MAAEQRVDRRAIAFERNAMGIVNDAVQDGVAERGIADHVMPAVDGKLAGDEQRSLVVAVVDDLEQIATLLGGERLRSPVVAVSLISEIDTATLTVAIW
jgi:hypothetical protein